MHTTNVISWHHPLHHHPSPSRRGSVLQCDVKLSCGYWTRSKLMDWVTMALAMSTTSLVFSRSAWEGTGERESYWWIRRDVIALETDFLIIENIGRWPKSPDCHFVHGLVIARLSGWWQKHVFAWNRTDYTDDHWSITDCGQKRREERGEVARYSQEVTCAHLMFWAILPWCLSMPSFIKNFTLLVQAENVERIIFLSDIALSFSFDSCKEVCNLCVCVALLIVLHWKIAWQ